MQDFSYLINTCTLRNNDSKIFVLGSGERYLKVFYLQDNFKEIAILFNISEYGLIWTGQLFSTVAQKVQYNRKYQNAPWLP